VVAKRIIPCLDIKSGRTVKGTNFVELRDMGDPVELARRYSDAGADELVFLDISATDEERSTTLDVVARVAKALTIPFTVGGGISRVEHVVSLLDAGADKVALNSAAIRSPDLIDAAAKRFGSQCVVVAIDSKNTESGPEVYVQGGKVPTGRNTIAWAREAVQRGAGEILLTSIDNDGVRSGFAISLIHRVQEALSVPLIASGGAGQVEHFLAVLTAGGADAALAAGVFHEGLLAIDTLKLFLQEQGVDVRL
jgi:cyclase